MLTAGDSALQAEQWRLGDMACERAALQHETSQPAAAQNRRLRDWLSSYAATSNEARYRKQLREHKCGAS